MRKKATNTEPVIESEVKAEPDKSYTFYYAYYYTNPKGEKDLVGVSEDKQPINIEGPSKHPRLERVRLANKTAYDKTMKKLYDSPK